jgi:hypothetical protein
MKIRLSCICIALLLNVDAKAQSDDQSPLLKDTDLYTKTVADCRAIDLSSWSHPVKKLLLKYEMTIEKVELCNGAKYPIFYARLKYDPEGDTQKFYHEAYYSILKSNGNFAYSIVDSRDNEIINISPTKGGMAISNEFFR